MICGLLLCLRQLIPLVSMETDDSLLLPKICCLLLRCCLHRNHNVVTGALEALSVLLWKPVTSLMIWLTTNIDHMIPLHPISNDDSSTNEEDATMSITSPPLLSDDDAVVTSSPSGEDTAPLATSSPSNGDILAIPSVDDNELPVRSSSSSSSDISISSSHSASDKSVSSFLSGDADSTPAGRDNNDSLLIPCDDHFIVSLSTTDASVSVSLASAHPTCSTPVLSCDLPNVDVTALQLPGMTTARTPIQALLQLLGTRLLNDHVKVSVKAVAIQCIVAIAMWNPHQLLVTMEIENDPKLIELLLPYMEYDDPKLCGNCCQLLSYYIRGMLLWDTSDHVMSVSSAIDYVVKVLTGNSATVLHAAIPSLQVMPTYIKIMLFTVTCC